MTPAERALLTSLYHVAMAALGVAPPRVAGSLRGLVAELCAELGIVNPLPSREDRRAARRA